MNTIWAGVATSSDFLEGFHGILQTDGYSGYEKISCEAHALCWVHARRYFVEAIPTGLEKEEIAETTSGQALNRINELFALDKELAEPPVAERQEERLRLEKDKLEALFMWLENSSAGNSAEVCLRQSRKLCPESSGGLICLSAPWRCSHVQ